ncbi:MAG: hypothetical protein ACM3NG_00295 [Candidatus Doudnabacteria bacterium]
MEGHYRAIFGILIVLMIVIVTLSGCTGKSVTGPSVTPAPTIVPTSTPTVAPTATPTIPTATPMSPPRSLNTGTYLVNKLALGEGRLSVDNNMSSDAVIILANESDPKHAVMAVYVKSTDKFTVVGIPDGKYVLYDMVGIDWDNGAKKFVATSENARFAEMLEYSTTEIHSRVYEISLQPEPAKNMNVLYLMPDQMPSI